MNNYVVNVQHAAIRGALAVCEQYRERARATDSRMDSGLTSEAECEKCSCRMRRIH